MTGRRDCGGGKERKNQFLERMKEKKRKRKRKRDRKEYRKKEREGEERTSFVRKSRTEKGDKTLERD